MKYTTVQYTVQCNGEQWSAVKCNGVNYSGRKRNIVERNEVTVQCSEMAVQCDAVKYSVVYNTAPRIQLQCISVLVQNSAV